MTLDDLNLPLVCNDVGPEFWAQVRNAKSRHDLSEIIEPIVDLFTNPELRQIAAEFVFQSLRKVAFKEELKIVSSNFGSGKSHSIQHSELWSKGDRLLAANISAARSHLRFQK